jgi:hypothetical protein
MADLNYLGPVLSRELSIATQLIELFEAKAIQDALALVLQQGGFYVSTVTTAAYVVVAADAGKYIRHTFNGAKTLQVQGDALLGPLDIGTRIKGRVANTGSLTITGVSGATVNAPTATNVVTANGTYDLIKVAANTWDLSWSN